MSAWKLNADQRSRPRVQEFHDALEKADAFLHSANAYSGFLRRSVSSMRHPPANIRNFEHDAAVLPCEPDRRVLAPRMPVNICEAFLHDPCATGSP